MKTLIVKNVAKETDWNLFKAVLASRGITIREWLVSKIKEEVSDFENKIV